MLNCESLAQVVSEFDGNRQQGLSASTLLMLTKYIIYLIGSEKPSTYENIYLVNVNYLELVLN